MKKFNALFFAMALVAVVAFASLASATTFVGIDKDGNIEKITVDPDATDKVMWEKLTGTSQITPTKFNAGGALIGHKFFSFEGGIVAISADVAANKSLSTSDDVVLFKVDDNGTVSYVKNLAVTGIASGDTSPANTAYSGVKQVVALNGAPVFISDQAISTILNYTDFIRINISADTAFAMNNKLYLLTSADGDHDKYTHHQLRQISEFTTSTTKSTLDTTKSPMKGAAITWVNAVYPGAFATEVLGDYVYVANETGIFKFEAKETSDTGIILTGTAPTVETTSFTGKYLAMTADDKMLYVLKQKDGKILLMSISTEDNKETPLCETISTDVKGLCLANGENSFDVYYDPTDKVFAVVNHGVDTAFYVPDGSTYKLLTKTDVYPSLAMVKTASTTPVTPDTPATSTVVDASKITDTTEVANLTKASGAAGTSAFVAQSDVTESTGTAPSTDTQAAVKEKAGFDNSTVAAVKDYTLAKKGYVLVTTNPGYNAANVKVYFVKKAASSSASVAAAEESFTASLLDSSYAAISTGTSAYATSTSELEAGDYTLVTVTKTASSDGSDDGDSDSGSTTSSSSGGCNAGFAAVSALLALAFVKKSR